MEVITLGTSAGTPTLTRNVSATAIRKRNKRAWYLVDCGEGTQHQLLRTHLSLHQLEAIFITHVHGDHCYGLPGILASTSMSGRRHPLVVVAPQTIRDWLEITCKITDMNLNYEIVWKDSLNMATTVQFESFLVSTVTLSHRVPSRGFVFEERLVPKLDTQKLTSKKVPPGPIWGELQKGNEVEFEGTLLKSKDYLLPPPTPRTVIIGGDNDQPECYSHYMTNCQLMIHEATYTAKVAETVGDWPQHTYARQLAEFAEKYSLPNLVMTHFSPRYTDSLHRSVKPAIDELREEAMSFYSGNLMLANDFDIFLLDNSKSVQQIKQGALKETL
ncbi:MAG: ribonuclease Z [Pseudomonadota bacterium]